MIALVDDLMHKINDMDMRDGGCRVPKPMVIFAEQGILQPIYKQLVYLGIVWNRRGHLFIRVKFWANLYEVINGTEHVTLGSITFALAEGMFNWTFNGEDDFENYLLRQTPNSNDFNPFFAKFWQDYFDCHLPKHYSYHRQECRTGMSIGRPREDRMSLQQNQLDTEDVVAKGIVMAGLLFAYGIKDAIFDNCFKENLTECASSMFISAQGRKLLFQNMESALITRNIRSTVRDLKPLDMHGNGFPSYTVYNIIDLGTDMASYEKVFEIKKEHFISRDNQYFTQVVPNHFSTTNPYVVMPHNVLLSHLILMSLRNRSRTGRELSD